MYTVRLVFIFSFFRYRIGKKRRIQTKKQVPVGPRVPVCLHARVPRFFLRVPSSCINFLSRVTRCSAEHFFAISKTWVHPIGRGDIVYKLLPDTHAPPQKKFLPTPIHKIFYEYFYRYRKSTIWGLILELFVALVLPVPVYAGGGQAWLAHIAGQKVGRLLHLNKDENLAGYALTTARGKQPSHHLQQLLTLFILRHL